MYDSLKAWANIPVQVLPFVKRTGTGAKQFGERLNTKCYAQGEVTTVKNADGEEVISNTQLYFDGTMNITALDRVIFDGVEQDIKSVTVFYRDGRADIKVVYL